MDAETPTFNLKAVVRETGLKAETLRAWERRYGIPRPVRSAGGHRIYSSRDIETLQWLTWRQREGLSISRAVERWQAIEGAGRDPLRDPAHARTRDSDGEETAPEALFQSGGAGEENDRLSAFRGEWLAACFDFDRVEADRVAARAFSLFPLETVCLDLYCRALRVMGELWHANRISTHKVSFAATLAAQRIEIILGATPPPTLPWRILLACPQKERHVFGLALLQLLLRRKGFETVFLGGNVPMWAVRDALQEIQPDLVILASQHLGSAGNLKEMSERVFRQGVSVAFGGRILNRSPDIRRSIPGFFLGRELDQAASRVVSLLTASDGAPEPQPIRTEESDGCAALLASLPRISALAEHMEGRPANGKPHFVVDQFRLREKIEAALKLGDLSLVVEETDWLCDLLRSQQVPFDLLERHLSSYQEAVYSIRGSDGDPVVEALEAARSRVRFLSRQQE